MKKLLFISIAFWCNINLNAQQEFAPIGAVWYFDKIEDVQPEMVGYVKITSIKDTLLFEYTSRVLEKWYFTSSGDSIYWGKDYIHQSGDTIFYLKDSTFKVLYNFGLSVGDTFEIYGGKIDECSDALIDSSIINAVETININNTETKTQYHVSINLSPTWLTYTVNSVLGEINGFYPVYAGLCSVPEKYSFGSLRCYSDDKVGLYKRWRKSCDTLINDGLDIETALLFNGAIIYPAISADFITIEINDPFKQEATIEVYNLQGHLVLKDKISTSEYILDIKNLKQGLYILRIIQKGSKTIVNKIIKE
jgi:hypothetical protein